MWVFWADEREKSYSQANGGELEVQGAENTINHNDETSYGEDRWWSLWSKLENIHRRWQINSIVRDQEGLLLKS